MSIQQQGDWDSGNLQERRFDAVDAFNVGLLVISFLAMFVMPSMVLLGWVCL